MDVEKTIEFLLQSQAQQEANLGSLTGLMRDLALAQMRTQERVQELALLQREHSTSLDKLRELQGEHSTSLDKIREHIQELALLQREHSESLKQTRENLDALIRVVDEIVRRNGRH